MTIHDYPPSALADDLEALFRTQPSTLQGIPAWNEQVRAIERRLEQGKLGTPYVVPPHVWRWVNDIDIRLRDQDYDRWLTRRFLEDLERLRHLDER